MYYMHLVHDLANYNSLRARRIYEERLQDSNPQRKDGDEREVQKELNTLRRVPEVKL